MLAIRRFSLFLLLAGTLAASTVLPVNFARLSRSAHHVVAGRVTSITADKDPATGYIFSKVTLAVSEAVPSSLVGREYSFRMSWANREPRSAGSMRRFSLWVLRRVSPGWPRRTSKFQQGFSGNCRSG